MRFTHSREESIRKAVTDAFVSGGTPVRVIVNESDERALREELGLSPLGSEMLDMYAASGVLRIIPDGAQEAGSFRVE